MKVLFVILRHNQDFFYSLNSTLETYVIYNFNDIYIRFELFLNILYEIMLKLFYSHQFLGF